MTDEASTEVASRERSNPLNANSDLPGRSGRRRLGMKAKLIGGAAAVAAAVAAVTLFAGLATAAVALPPNFGHPPKPAPPSPAVPKPSGGACSEEEGAATVADNNYNQALRNFQRLLAAYSRKAASPSDVVNAQLALDNLAKSKIKADNALDLCYNNEPKPDVCRGYSIQINQALAMYAQDKDREDLLGYLLAVATELHDKQPPAISQQAYEEAVTAYKNAVALANADNNLAQYLRDKADAAGCYGPPKSPSPTPTPTKTTSSTPTPSTSA
jgi:tetratricopeptide (TPR) repeat protein